MQKGKHPRKLHFCWVDFPEAAWHRVLLPQDAQAMGPPQPLCQLSSVFSPPDIPAKSMTAWSLWLVVCTRSPWHTSALISHSATDGALFSPSMMLAYSLGPRDGTSSVGTLIAAATAS